MNEFKLFNNLDFFIIPLIKPTSLNDILPRSLLIIFKLVIGNLNWYKKENKLFNNWSLSYLIIFDDPTKKYINNEFFKLKK